MSTSVCAHWCTCMPVRAEAGTWVLSSTDIFYFLRQGVSVTNPRLMPLARVAGQLGSRILYLHPLPLLGCPAPLQKAWAFHIHSGDPNSGLRDGAVDPVQTKPSPCAAFIISSVPVHSFHRNKAKPEQAGVRLQSVLQSTTQDPERSMVQAQNR